MPIRATSANAHGQRRRELALELGRGRVQVGVERVRRRASPATRAAAVERDGRRVDAEDDVGAADGLAVARRVRRCPPGRRAGSQPRTRAAGRDEVGGDPAAGLAEAEHGDLHQPSTISRRPVQVVGELACGVALSHRALALGALERERQHLVDALARQRHRSVAVHDDEIARPDLGAADRRPARRASRPRPSSRPARARTASRSAGRSPRARRGRARRRRRGSPRRPAPAPASPAARRRARPARARRSSARGRRPGSRARSAACTIVLSRGAQSAVRAGPATREPGTTWVSGEVDDADAAGGLVHRRDAEPGEGRVVGHSASTTTGISRWNASA